MLTMFLQITVTVLQLAFAGVAIAIARHATSAPELHRAGWLLTGVAFGFAGVIKALQNVAGTWAILAGPESAIWAEFLYWRMASNHSRGGIELAMLALLLVALLRGRVGVRFWWLSAGALLLGALGGVYLGVMAQGAGSRVHYSVVAAADLVQLLATASVLIVALARRGMDSLHWAAFATHTVEQAFNAIWYSAVSWIELPGVWSPSVSLLQVYVVVFATTMLALAVGRLVQARRSATVPSLLELGERSTLKTSALP